jgi:UDP-N-acetylglucosamine diphosphorylase/glucosamine-1-phosphate N-acetyltransferase
MQSSLPKVLHPLAGRPLLSWVIEQAGSLAASPVVIVIGHQAQVIREAYATAGLIFVEQSPQLGTGHAVLTARPALVDYVGPVLILCGDVPLLKGKTLAAFLAAHRESGATLSLMTAILPDPTGYGRIGKDPGGNLARIVEERDADAEEKKIGEINTGIYCVESSFLFAAVGDLSCNNAQGEYYLTDIVAWGAKRQVKMVTFPLGDSSEAMGINSPADLARAEQIALLDVRR